MTGKRQPGSMSSTQRQDKAIAKLLAAGGRILPATHLTADANAALEALKALGLTQRAAVERSLIHFAAGTTIHIHGGKRPAALLRKA